MPPRLAGSDGDTGNTRAFNRFPSFLLEAIKRGDWKKAEWCKGSNGSWFASDVYVYEFNYERTVGHIWQEFSVAYYLKFCIGARQMLIYMVSCHTSS